MENKPSLQDVRDDIVAFLYTLAHTLDLQIRAGSGAAMLGLNDSDGLLSWPSIADFHSSEFDLVDEIDAVYHYAFLGEVKVRISDDPDDGNLGRLQALRDLVLSSWLVTRNFDDVAEAHGHVFAKQAFGSMIKAAGARYRLDNNRSVGIDDIALLADLNERSVRNALHASGDAMLLASRNEKGELQIERAEALRWLKRGRKFRETVFTIPHAFVIPEHLAKEEIIPFLRNRFREQYNADWKSRVGFSGEELEQQLFQEAARQHLKTEEEIRRLFPATLDELAPDDCLLLAQVLHMDPAALAARVMRVRYPVVMEELKPYVVTHPGPLASPFNEKEQTLEITLTDAGIRNGYFDMERRFADRLFPADSFGTRSGDVQGQPVTLHHDIKGSPYETDVRIKTENNASFRKRFSAYFTAHGAKGGDVIRIKRTSDRSYELTFISK